MGFSVQVQPGRDLTTVRRNLRQLGEQGLGRQLSKGLQRAARPLKPAIQASALKVLPKRGGYAELMSKSIRMRTEIREARSVARVQIRVYAAGKQEKRDIPRINKGVLRHPIPAGRRHPWVDQRVRRGFVDRPVDGLGPDIRREMNAVVQAAADLITKG